MKKNKSARKRNSRAPKEKISSDPKAVKNADMSEEMHQDAVDIVTEAPDKGDKVTNRKVVNVELDKMTKRNLDNVELDDVASSCNDQEIDYNKNYIEKILYLATNKSIKVFLSYLNDSKQDTFHYSATDELIEEAKKLYVLNQSNNAHYYLVVNRNKKGLADGAYLAYFSYSKKHAYWKCNIEPLIDYRTICTNVVEFLRNTLEDMEVNIYRAQIHYDLSIIIGSIEQVIEYTKLRLKYPILNKDNLKQYELEFNNIKHIASLSINYYKNHIEHILYLATNKNIKVFLSYSKQDTLHYSATDELIAHTKKLYVPSNDAHYYLVVNLNKKGLVDGAYLAYFHYCKKRRVYWKCSIEPLIDYRTICTNVVEFLRNTLEDMEVNIYGVQMHYDLSIVIGSIEQVIEYTKLRINYPILNKDNLKQYESEFNNMKYNIKHIASLSNDQKIDYYKNCIEKTLYLTTKKNIEVFLGYSNEPKQDTPHYSATYELIEQAKKVYFPSNDKHYYLVVNLNTKDFVDGAYLAYFCFSEYYCNWVCSIEPLIDYETIDTTNLVRFLRKSFEDKIVMMHRAPIYYIGLTMTIGSIEQVIKLTKLRILLFK